MPIARDRKGVLVLVASMGAVMAAVAVAGAVAAMSPGGVSDGGTRPYRLIVPATAAGLPIDRSRTEAYGPFDMEQSDDRLVVFRGLTGSGSAVCTPPAHDTACVSMTSTTIVFIEFAPAEPAWTPPIRPERALEILHGVRAAVEQPA
ncbi:hypothetical protein ABZ914_07545 [Spirillospora sp. NPDC046719]